MLALPPSGRRIPPPPRTLLLGLRSYGLMRQSRVALRSFGFWPRSWSLRRLLPAPAATGILPTLSLRILPQMPEPIPQRFAECVCLVLPQHSSAFPIIRLGQLPASFREHDFPRVGFRGCSYFLMFRPPSLLASQIVSTAVFIAQGSRGFYIRAERASLPSHASDMLSARQQAISGTRTFISQDSQPCRLLPNDADVSTVPPINLRRVFPSTAGRLAFQAAPSPVSRRLSRHQACPARHVGLRLPFVHSVATSGAPLCVGTMDSVMHRHSRS
jgi:hypothetical protein